MSEDLDIWMSQARDQGDQEAFARVVEDCQHLLRATLLRDTADPDLADELAQDAFARAWQKREQYRSGTSPRAWLLAIARSQFMEHHRRADRDRRHMRDLVRSELLRHQPRETSADAERLMALRACLAELGEEHRQLLDLVHSQGLSSDVAAETMGIRHDACRQRLSRLQRKLKDCTERRLGIPATPAPAADES
jgi:RNA polymerase sigma-70 factor (ECF subfamily)